MALELIAALIAAATLGLLVWALRRWRPGLPQWSVPFAAAVGLVGFTIWSEYDWYDRVSAELPPELEVVAVQDEAMPLRPWTYLKPIKMRFVALDHRKTLAHPQKDGLRMVTLYSFARWKPVSEGLMAMDCTGNRQVMVADGVTITPEGELVGADWVAAPDSDKLQAAACREG
jgi:hypothetical protein